MPSTQSGGLFTVLGQDGAARRGCLALGRGAVDTPAFMPVGTLGAVKGVLPPDLERTGAQMALANTYHLMLRPGAERVAELGGLHRFWSWKHPILTDSGGYQVFSLAQLRSVEEEGVRFRSHIDGSEHLLTPERSVQVQDLLQSDVVMAFDECIGLPATEERSRDAMLRTLRWAERSRAAFAGGAGRAIFGIQQGGADLALREDCSRRLADLEFDGYAIGGLAVGEPPEQMHALVGEVAAMLPDSKIRYLMGVGKPKDIVVAVRGGVDLFDCVLPTRSGRNGQAFTRFGSVNLRNARHAADPAPLDPQCGCPCCASVSRAYLHHLVRCGELNACILLTLHNLHYYQQLMRRLRDAVASGCLEETAERFEAEQAEGDSGG